MPDGAATTASRMPPMSWPLGVALLVLSATGIGFIFFFALAAADGPVWIAPFIPFALLGGGILVWNPFYGLCFAAFAIGPLGAIQREFFSVTINLPEVIILALVLKEAFLFVVRGERLSPLLPKASLAAYVGASLVGLITAAYLGNSFKQALQDWRQYIEYIVLYLLALHRVHTPRQVKTILFCFMAGMTLVSLHGMLQRFTGIGIAGNQVISDQVFHGGIRSGSFYGATPLGGLMVLAVGIAVGLVLASRSYLAKLIGTGCVCTCLAAAVFTSTRASWIAIAFALAWIFFSVRKTKIMIAVTVVIGVLFSVAFGHLVVQRLGTIEISHRERSLLQRINYYTAAWHIFREYPVFGLGWGCEFSVKAIVKSRGYVPPPPSMRVIRKPLWIESTVHSAYLQILVRTGAIGLASLLWFLFLWFQSMLRARRLKNLDESVYNLITGMTAALLGYLLHSTFENFFQWPVMAQSFWLLLALSTRMAALANEMIENTSAPDPKEG